MIKLTTFYRVLSWATLLLIAGCAGITPYDPPAYGEAPPGRGLFSGAKGEFVIYQESAEADLDAETNRNSE